MNGTAKLSEMNASKESLNNKPKISFKKGGKKGAKFDAEEFEQVKNEIEHQ